MDQRERTMSAVQAQPGKGTMDLGPSQLRNLTYHILSDARQPAPRPRRLRGARENRDDCDHPFGFKHDDRVPYRARTIDGHMTETWRECCQVCGAWVVVERVDGVIL